MLHTSFPESLSCLVIGKLEPNGGLVILKLPGPYLDVEIVSLVRQFQNFRPSESVYSEPRDKKRMKVSWF